MSEIDKLYGCDFESTALKPVLKTDLEEVRRDSTTSTAVVDPSRRDSAASGSGSSVTTQSLRAGLHHSDQMPAFLPPYGAEPATERPQKATMPVQQLAIVRYTERNA